MIFGPDYVEELDGPGSVRLRLRLLRAEDAPRLRAGFAALSPDSRYRRFFTAKDHLSDAELRYLTEVDGIDHFAVALAVLHPAGTEGQGVGIGRFVRLADEPQVAEPALAIIDAMQGHGLGRLLMLRLVAAAAERDIEWFRCEFLANNDAMRELLAEVSEDVSFVRDGAVVTATMRLPPVAPDRSSAAPAPASALAKWLAFAAARWVQLRHDLAARLGPR